jgi:hypothetical protein
VAVQRPANGVALAKVAHPEATPETEIAKRGIDTGTGSAP